MFGFPKKFLPYLLRASGIFFLHISGILDLRDELKSYVPMFQDSLEYAGYLPHLYSFLLALGLLVIPRTKLEELVPKILSEAALCSAVFFLNYFIEDQGKTLSDNLPQLEEDFGFDEIQRPIILLGSILTVTKLLQLSSHSLFSRGGPALYLLRALCSLLGPSVLDTASCSRMKDGMTGMLVALFLLSSPILIAFGQYTVLLIDTLEELDLFKLVEEAWQGRFEASAVGEKRRVFYNLALQRLTEVWRGATIYLSARFVVLLSINVLQQQAGGDWLGILLVSLVLTLDSPCMFQFFFEYLVPAMSIYLLRYCHLGLYHCGAGIRINNYRSVFKRCFLFYARPIGIALLHLEMSDRAVAVSILPMFVMAVILKILLASSGPVLDSLPASNTNLSRHIPPLIINLCGLILPLVTVYYLLIPGALIPSTWSLAILAICLVVAVQGLVNISIYLVITWDLHQTKENPNTEEFKYHLLVLHSAVSLFYAVAVIFSGIFESFLKHNQWPVLNSIILLGNMMEIGSGIRKFVSFYLARRKRLRNLSSSLTTATKSQLVEHGDVCSICYLNMENPEAVITLCNHYFHLVCLKKWIISQQRETCPHCTSPISSVSGQKQ